jgi:class 3 adenylate cyclase/tetratricopeptide (TPR) repeat protein
MAVTEETALRIQLDDPPWAYIPRDRRRALAVGEELPTRVSGSALFADISGFTPLTEALANELGSQRASETLSGHLNRVFHAVIGGLDRYGGDVVYFSGDAITCWLEGDDGTRAVAAGFAMQEAIAREGQITTPGGLFVQLGLKVAIAVGDARRFVVGDPEIQLIEVLAGGIVDRIADAEHEAESGDIVLSPEAVVALAGRVELAGTVSVEGIGRVAQLLVDVPETPPLPEVELSEELARQWLLPAVYERLSSARGRFLAELRPAFPVFVKFDGIDYDGDEGAIEQLDEFVRGAQRILTDYGGNVLQLTLGDKGAYLYAVFGTPFAHEDDAARACAAALELQKLPETTAARHIQIGITNGRLRSGTYGHEARRTFVCLGDAVNLSARLMSKAGWGEIYVSELVRRLAGAGFEWTRLEPLQLKGKASPVAAYSLTATTGARSRRVLRYALPIVGRDAELRLLGTRLADAALGRGGIVGIAAEAGMGKSRLLAEFVREARSLGHLVAMGECQSFGTRTNYAVWEEIWRALLAVPDTLPEPEQVEALTAALGEIDPVFVERAPLLDSVLNLPLPDNDLTASFDAKLRKTSLENLLADCLRELARTDTRVIVLEDCHWLDPLSRDLLDVLARVVADAHLLLVLAYRPEGTTGLSFDGLPGIEELALDTLEEPAMRAVVEGKLSQLVGEDADVPGSLLDVVVSRAQGNPFYAEELLNYIDEQDVDLTDELALRRLELPGSLHSLVLGRIDTLSEAPRHTLKVASVVGRVFRAPVIPAAYPDIGTISDVRAHLGTLRSLDLVNVDREDDESYLFKHAVTHEVAYESLPYALRAVLHGDVGRWLEEHEPVDRNLDLLAHHFWHGDDEERKRLYLRRAGEAAQAAYANAAAIDYYERLAPLVPGAERVEILLELGKVLTIVGRWDDARRVEADALELATSVGDTSSVAWCETALAEVARKQGEFDEASERLENARAAFAELGHQEGAARVLHLEGTLAAQRGDIGSARERYEESLRIREGIGDRAGIAALLNNLAIMAEWDGDYDRGLALHERAYALLTELGDRKAIAGSMMNIGMNAMHRECPADALGPFQESMRLNREVGDLWEVGLVHHNLANAARALGDDAEARLQYSESISIYRGFEDRWALALLVEDVAVLAASTADPVQALRLIGSAESLRDEIGSPRATSLQEELDGRLASARTQLGDVDADAAIASGRTLDLDAAVALALEVVVPPVPPTG